MHRIAWISFNCLMTDESSQANNVSEIKWYQGYFLKLDGGEVDEFI